MRLVELDQQTDRQWAMEKRTSIQKNKRTFKIIDLGSNKQMDKRMYFQNIIDFGL